MSDSNNHHNISAKMLCLIGCVQPGRIGFGLTKQVGFRRVERSGQMGGHEMMDGKGDRQIRVCDTQQSVDHYGDLFHLCTMQGLIKLLGGKFALVAHGCLLMTVFVI